MFLGNFLGASLSTSEVKVTQFGARGDGCHDNAAAIQSAFESGAKTIYFPPGDYLISHPVQGVSGTRITGAGKFSTTILSKEPMNLIECIGLTEFSDFEVSGIGFSGIKSDPSSRGLNFSPLGTAGEAAYHHISIHDCYFHEISLGFVFNNQNTSGSADDWQISDIEVYNCIANGVRAGLGLLNVRRAIVSNCMVKSAEYDAIDLLNSEQVVISGLQASNCGEYGVIVRDRFTNGLARVTRSIVIANCVFDSCRSGVLVANESDGGGVQDVEIDNCVHRDSVLNGFTVSGALTENISMNNCVARNTPNRGFYIVDTKDTTVSNCRSYEAGIAGFAQAGNPVNLRMIYCQSDSVMI